MNKDEKLPHDDFVVLLRDVLETNQAVVKQNAMIIQALTLPQLRVKADHELYPWNQP